MAKQKVPDWFYANPSRHNRDADVTTHAHRHDMRRLCELQELLRKPDGYRPLHVNQTNLSLQDYTVTNDNSFTRHSTDCIRPVLPRITSELSHDSCYSYNVRRSGYTPTGGAPVDKETTNTPQSYYFPDIAHRKSNDLAPLSGVF